MTLTSIENIVTISLTNILARLPKLTICLTSDRRPFQIGLVKNLKIAPPCFLFYATVRTKAPLKYLDILRVRVSYNARLSLRP